MTLPTALGLPPAIFLPAEALGLGTARSLTAGPFGPDDLNAMDVLGSPPTPPPVPSAGAGALALLALGLLGLGVGAVTRRAARF